MPKINDWNINAHGGEIFISQKNKALLILEKQEIIAEVRPIDHDLSIIVGKVVIRIDEHNNVIIGLNEQ